MAKTAHTPSWLKFFNPPVNFFQLLRQQSNTTLAGALAFRDWLARDASGRCDLIHKLEHQADDQKMEIERKLAETIVTPFDREDIYDISARLDCIINSLKKTAKDIEYYPYGDIDDYMKGISEALVIGVELIASSVDQLEKNLSAAEDKANEARKTETKVGKIYRQALGDVYEEETFAQALRRKAIYDSLAVVANRVELTGEKLLHLSIKLS